MGKLGGMCMNWKMLVGLGIVGLGVWAVAPNLIGAALPILLIAACPLSMLFMMRGMGGGSGSTQPTPTSQPVLVVGTHLNRYYNAVSLVSGLFLIFIGILLFTDTFSRLSRFAPIINLPGVS